MSRIRIENKKVFVEFVAALIVIISVLFFLTYKIIQFKQGNNTATSQKGKGIGRLVYTAPSTPTDSEDGRKISQTGYENSVYQYKLDFPDNWYVNDDFSKSALEIDQDNQQVFSGGQIFWSNYENINDFSPDQKPADFHLLGLTIYEALGLNADAIADLSGFDSTSTLKTQAFAGKGITGKQYVAAGEDDENPLVIVIFQNGKRFFVFNLGFINGDVDAATAMENIVKTFSLR